MIAPFDDVGISKHLSCNCNSGRNCSGYLTKSNGSEFSQEIQNMDRVPTYNSSTREVEAGGLGQPRLYNETLIQKQKQNKQQYEKHQTQFTYPVV
jgi:hypothetical protein